jgi:hypothetical protein
MKLRFSIRDLLWLTVMVALLLGWLFDRQALIHQRDHFKLSAMIARADIKEVPSKTATNNQSATYAP